MAQDFDSAQLSTLLTTCEDLIARARAAEDRYADALGVADERWQFSSHNLLHYLALREQDIRATQRQLGRLGLSRLGRAESHVMASLLALRKLLHRLLGQVPPEATPPFSIDAGKAAIDSHAEALLGRRRSASRSRVMVTMPSDAAEQPQWLVSLIEAGMSAARINCAKDGPDTWLAIIEQIRKAEDEAGRKVKICMDLGGPKLRTGPMETVGGRIFVEPPATPIGQPPRPARLWLAPEPSDAIDYDAHLPINEVWLRQIQVGDLIGVEDTMRRQTQLWIQYTNQEGVLALSQQELTFRTGTSLRLVSRPSAYPETQVRSLPSKDTFLLLRQGDSLHLTRDPIPGRPAEYNAEGALIRPPHISCTLPEIFDQVKVNERVLFNDGKIEGIIREVTHEEMQVEITFAKPTGSKLRADKGINFPDSRLQISGLTSNDRSHLSFVAEHADVVSMSFVNSPADVYDLLSELERLGGQELGVVLKIETRQGYLQLPGILLAAMQHYPVGVMIARGDLAVEVGWQELALVQEEISRICEAAHVPTIWATQVLETLAKKGRPSRAEITDAATARRAECVMLNKGPHILDAVRLLGTILNDMEEFHAKSAPMLPELGTEWPEALVPEERPTK